MEPLPLGDHRHLWLIYEGQEYTDAVVHDYEDRLGLIFGIQVNRVHILDFEGLTDELGGLRRQLSWRQFILAMGLHTAEEMETDGPLLHFYLGPAKEGMPQRITRLKDEVYELHQDIVGLRGVVDKSITDQSRPLIAPSSVAHTCHTREAPDRGPIGPVP
nr:hypothetical protein [Tanacetum cinerariifolium]